MGPSWVTKRIPNRPLEVITNQIKTNAGSAVHPAAWLPNQGFEMDFYMILDSGRHTAVALRNSITLREEKKPQNKQDKEVFPKNGKRTIIIPGYCLKWIPL